MRRFFPATWLLLIATSLGAAPVSLQVDPARTLVELKGRPFGINVNYLKDDASLRPAARPLAQALTEMGGDWLRYPGGEKSDWHLWSSPPFSAPNPVATSYYKTQLTDPLDFDEYMQLVKTTGAQPFVVVGYDSDRTGITKDEYLRSAVEWVRYANITRRYGVTHWEIGNENWQSLDPQTAARDVAEISRAMKAVDPTIKTGASGNSPHWWRAYLAADPNIDFFTVSNYTGTPGAYAAYAKADSVNLLSSAASALQAIDEIQPASARAGKSVVVAEFNSKDWSKNGWTDENDLGHALVNFENLGQLLLEPRITCGMLWNTRWMDPEKADNLFYALDNQNQLLPSGRVLAIWNQFLLARMVPVTTTPGLVAFASASPRGDVLNLLLLNKRADPIQTTLSVRDPRRYRLVESHRFSGKNESDTHPVWAHLPTPSVPLNALTLPGHSITVLSLRAATTPLPRDRHK